MSKGMVLVHEMRVDDMLSHGFTFKSGATAKDFGHALAPDLLYFVMCIPKNEEPSLLSKTVNKLRALLRPADE